jgi:hypothetical protein
MVFDLVHRPSECGAHPVKLDRRKGLEVEHNGAVADQVREVVDVRCEMNVNVVASLLSDVSLMHPITPLCDSHVQNNEQEDREQI